MQATVHGVAKSQARLSDFTFTFTYHLSDSLRGPRPPKEGKEAVGIENSSRTDTS